MPDRPDDDFDEAPAAQLLRGQAGVQQQLYRMSSQLRRLADRLIAQERAQREKHQDNQERLEELETVVVKGNGELSLVRKVDRVQSSIDGLITKVGDLAQMRQLVEAWRGRLEAAKDTEAKRRWRIGDLLVPLVVALVVVGGEALVHWLGH